MKTDPQTEVEPVDPATLRLLTLVREVARDRREILNRLRDAVQRNAQDEVMSLSRRLVGL